MCSILYRGTVWKIINGELTEVVPSSNPDSFCSSCSDEIQTPADLAPNIFTKEPLINEELMSSCEGICKTYKQKRLLFMMVFNFT